MNYELYTLHSEQREILIVSLWSWLYSYALPQFIISTN